MAYNNNGGGGKKSFDPSKYETVTSRKERLRKEYPDSIIYPIILSGTQYANHFVVIMTLIWRDKKDRVVTPEAAKSVAELCSTVNADNAGPIAAAIGLVLNADSVGYSLSLAGGERADKNAWVENCEESATGRALDNLGFHNGSASKDEMDKVTHMANAMDEKNRLVFEMNSIVQSIQSRNYDMNATQQECFALINRQFTSFHELGLPELHAIYQHLTSKLAI